MDLVRPIYDEKKFPLYDNKKAFTTVTITFLIIFYDQSHKITTAEILPGQEIRGNDWNILNDCD